MTPATGIFTALTPELRKEGKIFIFDSGRLKTKGFKEFIQGEIRYPS